MGTGLSQPSFVRFAAWLSARSWFSRIWILQEIHYARRIVVLCGSLALSWTKLEDTMQWTNALYRHVIEMSGDVGYPWIPRMFTTLRLARTHNIGLDLGTMLILSSGCRATDPRDKVYAVLNMTIEISTNGKDRRCYHGIVPDYRKSVGEVYMEATRAVLHYREGMPLLLFAGERHEGVQACRHMPAWVPSWVPDLACAVEENVTPILFGGRFSHLSSCRAPTDFEHPSQTGRVLSLMAARFDDIVDVSGTTHTRGIMHRVDDSTVLLSWIDLVNKLPLINQTKQPRREVPWRTIVADKLTDRHPTSVKSGNEFQENLETEFRKILFHGILQKAFKDMHDRSPTRQLPEQRPPEDATPEVTKDWAAKVLYEAADLSSLGVLENGDPCQLKSLTAEFKDYVSWHVQHADGNHENAKARLRRIYGHFHQAITKWGFRLCRTQNDFLGRGPNSVQPGDSIWIFDGVNVPIVLREQHGGHFEVVGQIYVHGIMKGECLDVERLKWERIALV